MATPEATPDDVRDRTNIDLGKEEITPYLKDAVFDLSQSNDIGSIDEDVRMQLEWRLAALKILGYRKGDRAYHSQSLGSMNRSYETKSTEDLRSEFDRIVEANGLQNPLEDEEFWHASVQG